MYMYIAANLTRGSVSSLNSDGRLSAKIPTLCVCMRKRGREGGRERGREGGREGGRESIILNILP